MFDRPYLLISFYPGARGFLLSKWLYRAGLVTGVWKIKNTDLKLDSTNHDIHSAFADLIFAYNTDADKELYNQFNTEIMSTDCNPNKIKNILLQSQAHPNTPVVNQFNGPCLLLTHLGADVALDNMCKVFSNLTVLKVVFDTYSEYSECHKRKYGSLEFADNDWEVSGQDYTKNYSNGINVKLTDIKQLNLDYLKGCLL
jgi:hypothetical protein